MEGQAVPNVTFKTRVRRPELDEEGNEIPGQENPYVWEDVTTSDIFSNKLVVIFSLPGAFTPTCDTYQLPEYELHAQNFRNEGVDDIYCVSVNDSFVMNAWAKSKGCERVKMIPDGSGLFTEGMGMLVAKDNLGFGKRSWRYAAVINNGVVQKMFIEPGKQDNAENDPFSVTSAAEVFKYLRDYNAVE